MKKTFPLEDPRHKPARVLDAIKHEVRKYLKRERRKRLPEEADFWAFDCQVGQQGPTKVVELADLIPAIDAASEQGWSTVYIEILARPAKAADKPANKPSGRPSDKRSDQATTSRSGNASDGSSGASQSEPPGPAPTEAANEPSDSKPSDSKPSDSKPSDSKSSDSKPSDSKPSAVPSQKAAASADDAPSDKRDA